MIGALIGAGASLLGGLMGKKSAEKQAAQNIKLQKQFAQQGIQWKVQDAEKAGIHPLYALGAQTHSFSPVSVGDPLPGAIADMGQGIGRAVESGMSSGGRAARVMQALSVQRAELENTKLATEIKLMNQPGQPPAPVNEAAVIPGQGNSAIVAKPMETIMNANNRATEPTSRPDIAFSAVKLPNGHMGYTVNPSQEIAESMESNPLGQLQFLVRNGVLPWATQDQSKAPPVEWLPPGYNKWKFDLGDGVWKPTFRVPQPGRYQIRSKGTY